MTAAWLALYTGLELLFLAAFVKAALIALPDVLDYLASSEKETP